MDIARGGDGERSGGEEGVGREATAEGAGVGAIEGVGELRAGGRAQSDRSGAGSERRGGDKLIVDPGGAGGEPRFHGRYAPGQSGDIFRCGLRPLGGIAGEGFRADGRGLGVGEREEAGVGQHALAERLPAVDPILHKFGIAREGTPPADLPEIHGAGDVPDVGNRGGEERRRSEGAVEVPNWAGDELTAAVFREISAADERVEIGGKDVEQVMIDPGGPVDVVEVFTGRETESKFVEEGVFHLLDIGPDVIALGGGEIGGLGVGDDDLGGATGDVARGHKAEFIGVRWIEFQNIAARDVGGHCGGVRERFDVHLLGIDFDGFGEDVDPGVVRGPEIAAGMKKEFDRLGGGSPTAEAVAQGVDEAVFDERLIEIPRAVERPFIRRNRTGERDVVFSTEGGAEIERVALFRKSGGG